MSEQKTYSVRMAKADKDDLEAAYQIMNLLDSMSRGLYPSSDENSPTFFDSDDWEHLQFLHQRIIEIAENSGGVSRVVGAAGIILNEQNNLIDPDEDCIELHPSIAQDRIDARRYRSLRCAISTWSVIDWIGDTLRGEALDAAIDAREAQQDTPRANGD